MGRRYDVDINNPTTTSISTPAAGRSNREILELARQKVEFATAQNAFGNGVPVFDTMPEALPAIGIAALT
jgi:hypothetical protein